MRRQTVYPGSIPEDTDFLNANKNAMIGLGRLCNALLGTGGLVFGLGVTPTSPASLSVNVANGELYQLQNVDNTAYGSLSADTTNTIVKQGILLASNAPAVLSCPAPATAGFSINYLIEATFAEVDGGNTVLPYYNAANPSQPYAGPNNTGAANSTYRDGAITIQAKAGVAATTGTQVTPAVDSGYVPLAVVTVANGQNTITAVNITAITTNVLPASLLQAIQNNQLNYAKDTGIANASVVTLAPAPASLVDGMVVEFQVAAANTGAATLNLNGLGAKPILGAAHSALQGGELVANGTAEVRYHAGLSSWVLLGSTGGSQQVAPATASNQVPQLSQVLGKQQLLTSSGSFTVPTGVTTLYCTAAGGGGGGGGGGGNSSTGASGGGGGGGGGAAIYKQAITVTSGQVLTVTIGAAGTSGPGGSTAGTNGTTGGNGGTTTITGTGPTVNISLAGGSGGVGSPGVTTNGLGGGAGGGTAGGTGGQPGAAGGFGVLNQLPGAGGAGGGSLMGPGGLMRGTASGSAGSSGQGFGAGGAGGSGGATNNQAGGAGGAGAPGAVLFEW